MQGGLCVCSPLASSQQESLSRREISGDIRWMLNERRPRILCCSLSRKWEGAGRSPISIGIDQSLQARTRIKGWREFFQPFIVSGLAEIGHYYIQCIINQRSEKRGRLAHGNRYSWHADLAADAGAKVFAVESPGAAYFMAIKLSRPHETIEGRAAYPQVAHSLFEC